jgi:NarL family two-component system response regulator LiaR
VIRIFILEDSKFLRELMSAELARHSDLRIMGSASSTEEGIPVIKRDKPDIVVMDLYFSGQSGIEAAKEIENLLPECKVVILTSSHSREDFFKALEAGVKGFVSKDSPQTYLLDAIQAAYDGKAFIDPSFTLFLIEEFIQFRKLQTLEMPEIDEKSIERLTLREIEILYLIGQGKSNADVSKELNVSEVTVKSHVHQILRKLAMTNRLQLALFANEIGLKKPPSKG